MARVISDNRTEYGIPHTVSCRALGMSEHLRHALEKLDINPRVELT